MALLDLERLLKRYALRPGGVIHVGAHHGQEAATYRALGLARQAWFEPNPVAFAALERGLAGMSDVRLFNLALGEAQGRAVMHTSAFGEGMCDSLLPPTALAGERWPGLAATGTIEVEVARLDDVLSREGLDASGFGLMVIDVQGYELPVLRGAERALREGLCAVVTEVSREAFYEGGALMGDLDAHLGARGFRRVAAAWPAKNHGDAMYVRLGALAGVRRVRARLDAWGA